jgi:type IV pilus assembly protein PilB
MCAAKSRRIMLEMNFLDEDTLVKALSKQLGLPRVDFKGLSVPEQVLQKVDAEFAEQRQVLPVSYDPVKNHLLVATADPADLALADELGFRTGCHVRMAIAGERALARAIREYYFAETGPDRQAHGFEEQSLNLVAPLREKVVSETKPPKPIKKPVPAVQETPASAGRTASGLEDKLSRLELLQRKQIRVIKVVVELLIERGYINRDEYRHKVEQ